MAFMHSVLGMSAGGFEILSLVFLAIWWVVKPLVALASQIRRPAAAPATGAVSILVPCHNAAGSIERTVRSLIRGSPGLTLEILCIENNSTDGTWAVLCRLARQMPEVRALKVAVPPGERPTSVALNYGLRKASHPIIVRIDADTTVPAGSVGRLIAPLMRGKAVAVAGNIRVQNPKTLAHRLQEIEYYRAMEISKPFERAYDNLQCCSGAYAAFRRDDLLDAGGYHLDPLISEDIEITWRMHQRGEVAYAPDALAYTDCPSSIYALAVQRMRWMTSGTIALYVHRSGIGNRSYGKNGLVGLVGLPLRLIFTVLLGTGVVVKLVAVALSGGHNLAPLALTALGLSVANAAASLFGMLVVAAKASERQGMAQIWLVPLFVAIYETVILAASVVGVVRAIGHIGAHMGAAERTAWIHRAPPYWGSAQTAQRGRAM